MTMKPAVKPPKEDAFLTRWNEWDVADDEQKVLERRLVVIQDLHPRWLNESVDPQRPVEVRGVRECFCFKGLLRRFTPEMEQALLSCCCSPLVVNDGSTHQIRQRRFFCVLDNLV